MSKNYLLKNDGGFVIKDYNRVHAFSNFLPGIAGEWGIPMWVFYVNRAQGVASFGIKDKDHSISEFFPANKAYSSVPHWGFRTFIKINGKKYYEPFKVIPDSKVRQEMIIKSASLEIREISLDLGLSISVKYFTLPSTSIGGLARVVSIKNISKRKMDLEVLDGLNQIVPFGSLNSLLKNMSRTLEAWMHSIVCGNLAIFRLIIDPMDISHTKYIEGANFNYSFYYNKGKKIRPYIIVDPMAVFSEDTSSSYPVNFLGKNFKTPLNQITCGRMPCSFSHLKWNLSSGQEQTFYSVFGSAPRAELIEEAVKTFDQDFLKRKEGENEAIIKGIKNDASCFSGSKEFDNYVKCTYLDNVLRGGYPYAVKAKDAGFGGKKDKSIYYIFSRKHGDLERDYNYFHLLPSYFSEGEANYRDINQNRRMDLFFSPSIGCQNISYFLNFIKVDGYNPLVIKGEKLFFKKAQSSAILGDFGIKNQKLAHLMTRGFYLGDFFKLLEEEKIKVNSIRRKSSVECADGGISSVFLSAVPSNKIDSKRELVSVLLEKAEREPQAHYEGGYWIDHWHYNLDLIESFLYFYPDRLKELFLDNIFSFWDDEYRIKDRASRYTLRGGAVYQGESVEAVKEKKIALRERDRFRNFLRTESGEVYKTNLVCKLLTLILNKAATLDPEGIGVEMEADKPGWCDSLNGLPALFGSSLCETFELKRAALILLSGIKHLKSSGVSGVLVPHEVFSFFNKLDKLLGEFFCSGSGKRNYLWWDKANSIKEDFRKKTFFHLKGSQKSITFHELEQFLQSLINKLNLGIKKAKDKKSELYFTYFTYKVKKYVSKDKRIIPYVFSGKPLPLFLEGVVHALRIEGQKSLCSRLKESSLFDKRLKMYRLNASLKNESLEIGRIRVFVPGWLENESIWLHMEYKYFLELLKRGFYDEFFVDFSNCGICYFDPQKYGRNILENSSFIVSSVHPDKALWGRGFVARLSGVTAEFLNIWIILCLGRTPFFIDKKRGFCLRFSPILKKDFFTTSEENIDFKGKKIVLPENTFSFKLFSKILVCYHNPGRKDTFSKNCRIERVTVSMNGKEVHSSSGIIEPPLSLAVRRQEVERIDVYFQK